MAESGGAPPKVPQGTLEFEPPAACINRIVKAALPENVQVTKEAKSAFSKSAGIFILYLTTCANDFCRDKKRQTVSAADVLAAVSELDLDDFKPQLQAFLACFRANEGSKRKKKKEPAAQTAAAAAPQSAAAADDDDDDDVEETNTPAAPHGAPENADLEDDDDDDLDDDVGATDA